MKIITHLYKVNSFKLPGSHLGHYSNWTAQILQDGNRESLVYCLCGPNWPAYVVKSGSLRPPGKDHCYWKHE